MTTRHLEVFLAVARVGSMSGAAKELYISQPTVSQVIAELEEHYHTRLFERLQKRLYITPAGQQLQRYAQQITDLFSQMDQEMDHTAHHRLLRVGATITIGSCLLPGLVARFESVCPSTQVQAYVDNTQAIEGMLCRSELDLALVEGKISSPQLRTFDVLDDQLVLICAPDHPLAKQNKVTPQQLQGQQFIMRETGSGTRALFEEFLRQNQVQINVKWSCHSSDSVLAAVAAGQGLAMLSLVLVQKPAAQGQVAILPLQRAGLSRSFQLVYHKDKYLSAVMRQFIKSLPHAPPVLG